MKRYVVMSVSKATESNLNFAGQVLISLHGKHDAEIGNLGSHAEATYMVREPSVYMLTEYGYSRKCDAVRSYMYKHPQNDKNWTTEVSILEIDV